MYITGTPPRTFGQLVLVVAIRAIWLVYAGLATSSYALQRLSEDCGSEGRGFESRWSPFKEPHRQSGYSRIERNSGVLDGAFYTTAPHFRTCERACDTLIRRDGRVRALSDIDLDAGRQCATYRAFR